MEKIYNPELRGGGTSWAVLGGVVLALEMREETLSNACARFRESSPVNRAITTAAIGVTALHLLDMIPRQIDPIDRLTELVEKSVDKITEGMHLP